MATTAIGMEDNFYKVTLIMPRPISASDLEYLRMKQNLLQTVIRQSGGGTPPNINGKTEFQDLVEKGIKEVNTAAREAEKQVWI